MAAVAVSRIKVVGFNNILIATSDTCREHDNCVCKEAEVAVTQGDINEEELR